MCLFRHFVEGMRNGFDLLQLFLGRAGYDDTYFRFPKPRNLSSLGLRDLNLQQQQI